MQGEVVKPRQTLTVIFPCYQEPKSRILEGMSSIERVTERFDVNLQVIVGQNGDWTKMKFTKPVIEVCYLPYPAFGEIIRMALEKSMGDYIYISSPDSPFGLMDLEQMLINRSDYDLQAGSKLHPESVYVIDWRRKVSTLMLSQLLNRLFPGWPVHDPNGSLFLAKNTCGLIKGYLHASDFFISTEIVFWAWKRGLRIKEIPVTYIKSGNSSTVRVANDGLKYIKQLWQLRLNSVAGKC